MSSTCEKGDAGPNRGAQLLFSIDDGQMTSDNEGGQETRELERQLRSQAEHLKNEDATFDSLLRAGARNPWLDNLAVVGVSILAVAWIIVMIVAVAYGLSKC